MRIGINAREAFTHFVSRVLERGRAERFIALSETKKGERKILTALCHQFEPAILPKTVREKSYDPILEKPCFVYCEQRGFGIAFDAVRSAYEVFSIEDSWLIILADGSAGIHRPEARWDDEKFIVA